MKTIDIGQTLYITRIEMFTETAPNLKECTVERMNSNSVYVVSKDQGNKLRLDRNELLSSDGAMHCRYKAYIVADDYWNEVAIQREKRKLQKDIENSLYSLNIDKLRLIKEMIE